MCEFTEEVKCIITAYCVAQEQLQYNIVSTEGTIINNWGLHRRMLDHIQCDPNMISQDFAQKHPLQKILACPVRYVAYHVHMFSKLHAYRLNLSSAHLETTAGHLHFSQNMCVPDIKYVTGWSQGFKNARTGRSSCTSSRCLDGSHNKFCWYCTMRIFFTPSPTKPAVARSSVFKWQRGELSTSCLSLFISQIQWRKMDPSAYQRGAHSRARGQRHDTKLWAL